MKRYAMAVLVLLLCLMAIPCAAMENLLVDDADLLSFEEEAMLREKLSSVTDTFQAEIVIATVTSTEGYLPDDFVEYFYDSNGYGLGSRRDGVLLLVDMNSRTYRILSNGAAADAISLGDIDVIEEEIAPALGDGDYAEAFHTFIAQCEYYLGGYRNGFPFETGENLLIAVIVGLVAALIVTGILRGQLNSVRRQYAAGNYIKQGSMQVTQATEFFLYRNVSRQAKPKNNSGSGRSSGSSRNVGGGRF